MVREKKPRMLRERRREIDRNTYNKGASHRLEPTIHRMNRANISVALNLKFTSYKR